jgi:hypothetical protein
MTDLPYDTVAWKFEMARNAMGGEIFTAYVDRPDREQAWQIVRSKFPHADLLREVALSAFEMSSNGQSPFVTGEDLRLA